MAAFGLVHPRLLHGIALGVLVLVATPGGSAGGPPAPAVAVEPLLYREGRAGPDAVLEYAHWNRFCRWYRHHRLCYKLVKLKKFCDRHRRHRFCDDDDSDRFCRKHPYHRHCDRKPPSRS